MSREKRKKPRRTIRYTAWVGVSKDSPPRGCVVSDISETGAKLELENPAELPETFMLLLSGRGKLYRLCHAVWRTEHHIGVHFDKIQAPTAQHELEAAC